MQKRNKSSAWLLLCPALLLLTLVGLIPLVTVVNVSLHDIFNENSKYWVGFEWYRETVSSERFLKSLSRSSLFSLIILIIEIPLGILVALSLPKGGAWRSICLVLISLPLLVPWNLIPIIWKVYLQSDIGEILQMLLAGQILDWKFNPFHTWSVLIAMDVWHWTSLVALLCFSSLTTIPHRYYQAALIDGASRWQVFRYIELPKMRNVLSMALLLRFVDSFMIYTESFKFNAGGPGHSTMFLAVDLGEDIFAFNYGPSAARSIIYLFIILTVAWLFTKTRQPADTYIIRKTKKRSC